MYIYIYIYNQIINQQDRTVTLDREGGGAEESCFDYNKIRGTHS